MPARASSSWSSNPSPVTELTSSTRSRSSPPRSCPAPRGSVSGRKAPGRRTSPPRERRPVVLGSLVPGGLGSCHAFEQREGGRDDAEGRQDPARGDEVVRGAGRHHGVLLRPGGEDRGGAEPGADRDGGDGQQRDGALERDDAAQRAEPGAGEP